MMGGRWHLFAPEGHAGAELIAAIYHWRGVGLHRHVAPQDSGFALQPPGAGAPALRDAGTSLRALPGGLEPGAETLCALSLSALERLEALIPARFPADLDLKVFALRQELTRLQRIVQQNTDFAAESLHQIALAPLLWRLGLVDESLGLFLLTGFDSLSALRARLLSEPVFAARYTAQARHRYQLWLQSLRGAAVDQTDWERALGPGGREKTLLSGIVKTEIPSIGSGPRFR